MAVSDREAPLGRSRAYWRRYFQRLPEDPIQVWCNTQWVDSVEPLFVLREERQDVFQGGGVRLRRAWILYEEPPATRAGALATGLASSVENANVSVCSGSRCYQVPGEGEIETMPREGVLILHSSDTAEFLARHEWLKGLARWPGVVIRFSAAKGGPTGLGIRRAISTGQEVQAVEWRELAEWVESGASEEALPGILGGIGDDQLCLALLNALWLYQLRVASPTDDSPIKVVDNSPIAQLAQRIAEFRVPSKESTPLPKWSGRLNVALKKRIRSSRWTGAWRNRIPQDAGLDEVLKVFAAPPAMAEEEMKKGIEFLRDDLLSV